MFAAASLTEAFNKADTGVDATFNFAGSGTLVTQIQQGATPDVVATADTASMQKLVDAGLVETPTVFAKNRLAVIVAPGDPKKITSVADLARQDITVVLCDSTVPAGKYAAQILTNASVTVQPRSLETDVKSAVARVTSGEADASIVYATDVKAAGDRAMGVDIPDAQNVIAQYPIAVVKASSHRDAAVAFISAMTGGPGRDSLAAAGFLPA